MKRSPEDEAMQKGLAAGDASLHLSSALRPVTEQILAAGRGEGEWPSETQLEEVRRRYLVYKALDENKAAAWQFARDNPYEDIFRWLLLTIYRLTVFASMAQASRRTVVACLDVLESLGLVQRYRRRRRERTELGLIREVQDCSAYVLTIPEGVETEKRPRPPEKAVYQSAKGAQQSALQLQSREVVRVAEAPRNPSRGPTRVHDWRARAREALNRTTRQWQEGS